MAYRRQLYWSAAMRDLRHDRAPSSGTNYMFARSMQLARVVDAQRTALARPLVDNGTYDLSAIMNAAIAEAKVQRTRRPGAPWRELMASALRFAWCRAKAQRALLN